MEILTSILVFCSFRLICISLPLHCITIHFVFMHALQIIRSYSAKWEKRTQSLLKKSQVVRRPSLSQLKYFSYISHPSVPKCSLPPSKKAGKNAWCTSASGAHRHLFNCTYSYLQKYVKEDTKDRSDFQCRVFDVSEMQQHAKHSYFNFFRETLASRHHQRLCRVLLPVPSGSRWIVVFIITKVSKTWAKNYTESSFIRAAFFAYLVPDMPYPLVFPVKGDVCKGLGVPVECSEWGWKT